MKHIIINVGRQVGAGGQEIGRMLAKDFEAKYYDRELLNLAAKESGFSEKFFKQNDEKKGFWRGLLNVQTPHFMGGNLYGSNFSQESLFKFAIYSLNFSINKFRSFSFSNNSFWESELFTICPSESNSIISPICSLLWQSIHKHSKLSALKVILTTFIFSGFNHIL